MASAKNLAYVVPQVVLELGTHAEFVPHDGFTIRSFVVEEFPALTPDGGVSVVALLAKRTFWEKVTILHAEFTARRKSDFRSDTPVTTMTLPCWRAGRFDLRPLPT
jgi:hypothetical protein